MKKDREIEDPYLYRKIKITRNIYISSDKFILYLSILFGTIIFLSGIILKLYLNYIALSALIVATYLVGALPYIFYKALVDSERRKVIDAYPTFLNDLSEALSAGMNMLQAVKHVSSMDYGPLSKFIRKLYIWLSWNVDFKKAFEMFNEYFSDLPEIKAINKVILHSYLSGGDIAKTLKTVASDLINLKELDKLKQSYVSQQKMVMFIIFFIFIGLLISILYVLQPIVSSLSAAQASNFKIGFGNINIRWLKDIAAISIIVEAISVSIISGIAESNRLSASFRYLAFTMFVAVMSIVLFLLPPSVYLELNVYPQSAYVSQQVTISISGSIDGNPINNQAVNINILLPNGNTETFTSIFMNGQATITYTPQISGNYKVTSIYVFQGQRYTQSTTFSVT